MILQTLSVGFCECDQQIRCEWKKQVVPVHWRPETGFVGELRFIGEDGGDCFSEMFPDGLGVCFMGDLDESLRGLWVQRVGISLMIEPVHRLCCFEIGIP